MIDKDKILRRAPCGADGNYPDILCEYRCRSCGWNPREQKRRTRKENLKRECVLLKDENGVAYRGVMVKRFKFRRVSNDDA